MSDPDDPTDARRSPVPRLVEATRDLGPIGAHAAPAASSRDGRYRLDDELARGGMGRVTRGRDLELGRAVAIKESLARDPSAVTRLLREAAITGRLQHPSIVPVYDVSRDPAGAPLLVMRLIDGRSLDRVIDATATLDQRLALVPVVMPAIEAVAFAHRAGVVHRDLKPGNILVGDGGDTVVIDWGLAREVAGSDGAAPRDGDRGGAGGEDSLVGAVVGTPGFMAPEQARGEPADARADVFALGATLFYTLTGQRPFVGESATRLIEAARQGGASPIVAVEPGVPRELATIVDKALAYAPADRYPSADPLAADLRAFLAGRLVSAHHYSAGQRVRRWGARHRGPLGIGLAALVAIAVVAVAAVRGVVAARDRARAAQLREAARADDLIELQARAVLADDPTRAIALMRLRGQRGDAAERAVVVEAVARGVAPQWRAHDRPVVRAVWLGGGTAALTADTGGELRWHDLRGGQRRLDGGAGRLLGPVALAGGEAAIVRDGALVRLGVDGEPRGRWTGLEAATALVADGDWVGWLGPDGATVLALATGDRRTLPATGLAGLSAAAGRALIERDHVAFAIDLATGAERSLGPSLASELSADGRAALLRDDRGLRWVDLTGARPPLEVPPDGPTWAWAGLVAGRPALVRGEVVELVDDGTRLGPLPDRRTGMFPLVHGLAVADGERLELFTVDGRRRLRLSAPVTTVATSPDGARILCGAADGRVSVWSVDPTRRRTLDGRAVGLLGGGGQRYVVALDTGAAAVVSPDDLTYSQRWSGLGAVALPAPDGEAVIHFEPARGAVEVVAEGAAHRLPIEVGGLALTDDALWVGDATGAISRHGWRAAAAPASVVDQLDEPVIAGAGHADGGVVLVGAAGAVWRRLPTGTTGSARLPELPDAIAVQADGGVAAAIGDRLWLWPVDGAPRPGPALPGPIALLLDRGGLIAVTADRRVWRATAAGWAAVVASDLQVMAQPYVGRRRVVAVEGDQIVLVDLATGQRSVVPPLGGGRAHLAILDDDRTVIAIRDGVIREWRDPVPTVPALLAAYADRLTNGRLDDVRAPLRWP
jgi:hypothetical protein